MQDQGKRLLMAVALALGVMLLWQVIFPPDKEDKPKPPPPTPAGQPAPAQPGAQVGQTPDAKPAPTPVARGPEQTIKLSYPNVNLEFSSYGGVLKSWHLTDRRYDRDATKGELMPKLPDTGAFAVNFANSTYVLPPKAEWVGTKVSDTEVKYTINTDNLHVEKRFVIVPASYIVKITVTAHVKVGPGVEAHQTLALSAYGFQDPKVKPKGGFFGQSTPARIFESATYRGDELYGTPVSSLIKQPRFETNFRWTGFEHPYLLVGIAPKPTAGVVPQKQSFAEGTDGLMRTDVLFMHGGKFSGTSPAMVHEAVAYLGPKHYETLDAADSIAGFSTAFKETVDLGWFAFIGKPLMWLLLRFYSFLQNWGLAIMLLTILVKGLTIPFTTKSMRSMKAMAVLAPQMKQLQEKYKEDKQRLQMETMALYKQHGANPLSGCLPILLQMPIWLALYRMLSSTGELYQQAFIPGWIDDLTNSDPFYVLPIVLMATMFAQARLQPMTADPSQKMQQRMMMYGLPLMFGVMAFVFPAGLTLYIFTNTILSALHSIYMNKFDKKSIALAAKIKAAQEATAANKAKDANPKKDKPVVAAIADDDADEGNEADAQPAPNKITPRQPNRQKRKKRRR